MFISHFYLGQSTPDPPKSVQRPTLILLSFWLYTTSQYKRGAAFWSGAPNDRKVTAKSAGRILYLAAILTTGFARTCLDQLMALCILCDQLISWRTFCHWKPLYRSRSPCVLTRGPFDTWAFWSWALCRPNISGPCVAGACDVGAFWHPAILAF